MRPGPLIFLSLLAAMLFGAVSDAGGFTKDQGGNTNAVGYYYHGDNLNTSSALSSSNGAQVEVNVYYPFGRVQTAGPQAGFQVSRRFTGQVFDAESGLYYYNRRYYDPELGRFIQPDDIIPDFSNPQSYNRYSYCVNNPLRYADPTGHGIWQDLGTIAGSWFAPDPRQPISRANNTYASQRTALLGPTENIMPAMVSKGVEMTGQAAQTVAAQYVGGKVVQVGGAVIGKAGGAILSKVTGAAGKVEQATVTAGSEAKMVPQVVQQAQGKPIMTQWGWQNSPAWRDAANTVGNAGHNTTLVDVGGKIPTRVEAESMISSQGGKVIRVDAAHAEGGVSTHTFPHINYQTAAASRATIRIQGVDQ